MSSLHDEFFINVLNVVAILISWVIIMNDISLDTKTTALVVIDLQKGIVGMPFGAGAHSAAEVVLNAKKLVDAFRKNNMPVVLVHVQPSKHTALNPDVDTPMAMKDPPKDWAEFVPEMTPQHTDIVIKKQQWGAFYGTDLDLQLRRRGIKTIVLCGIATNIGVESTARFAYEFGYHQVFAEDAMTTWSLEQHKTTIESIFKRIGRVRSTTEILNGLR